MSEYTTIKIARWRRMRWMRQTTQAGMKLPWRPPSTHASSTHPNWPKANKIISRFKEDIRKLSDELKTPPNKTAASSPYTRLSKKLSRKLFPGTPPVLDPHPAPRQKSNLVRGRGLWQECDKDCGFYSDPLALSDRLEPLRQPAKLPHSNLAQDKRDGAPTPEDSPAPMVTGGDTASPSNLPAAGVSTAPARTDPQAPNHQPPLLMVRHPLWG
ncbi:uncharacterized protein V6R79_004554 [Siganus canaliculatus]